MSKLEELIKEFCPNGVEYVKIGSVVNYEQPSKYLVKKADYKEEYSTPVLTAGQTFILGYTNEMNGIYNASKDSPVIIFDDFTGAFKWVDFPFKVKSSAIKFLKANEKRAMLRYIFHVMGNINLTSTEHKRLWIGIYSELQIPLPALPVQREIVQILDSFTLYSAELTAELTARRKQYEFYRDKLLMPKSSTYQTEWKELKDVCRLVTGATPSTSKKEYWENGTIPWMSSGEVNNKRIFYTEEKITELGYQSSSTTLVPIHSVVIALAGQGKTRGKVAITEIELCTNQSLCSLICGTSMNYKFLYYYLDGKYEELRAISNGDGTRGGLSLRLLAPYKIPVPPMEVQERIVKVLDNFDAICSDLGIGLPAEIEKRQKQYEYYREKLLTFDGKYATILTERNGTERNGTERNGQG